MLGTNKNACYKSMKYFFSQRKELQIGSCFKSVAPAIRKTRVSGNRFARKSVSTLGIHEISINIVHINTRALLLKVKRLCYSFFTVTVTSVNELIFGEDMTTVQNYLTNEEWVKRIDGVFTTFNANKDGYISAEDWMNIVDNLEKKVPDRPEAIAKLREATVEFTNAMGLTKGAKADKQKHRELLAAFCLVDAEKMKRGEMTSLEKYLNPTLDCVDKNRDGYVTFEEFKLVMEACNFGEEAAKATFNLLDKKKMGKIDRNEYLRSKVSFWYTLDDPTTKGMYGAKFE